MDTVKAVTTSAPLDKSQSPLSSLRDWKTWSFRWQLTAFITTVIVVVVVGVTAASISRATAYFRDEVERRAEVIVDTTTLAIVDALYFLDVDQVDFIADQFFNASDTLALRIYDPTGRILISPDDPTLEASLTRDPFGARLIESQGIQLTWQSDRLIAGKPVVVGSQVIGAVHIELPISQLNDQIFTTAIQSAIVGLLAIIASVAAVLFVSRTFTRPIRTLVDETQKIAAGRLTHRIAPQTGSSELTHLSKSVEEMRENLLSLYTDMERRIAERTVDLRNARDEALAAQRIAQENSRLKSEFLSTMSHELRTPLNAIEGFTSIMLSGMGVELSPQAEHMVSRVSANSKRLLALINDFLDLSRIESGRLELVKSPITLESLIQKWQHEVGVLATNKGIAFVAKIDPNLPPVIMGDEEALSKIAVNLLGNAFKFTHEGQVSLALERSHDGWLLSVQDTGIGIPPHAREYIFDEFRQVDGSSKREYGGTGLGLALVQKLSRAMGGSVAVQSEVGKGSTFTVTLPLEVADDSQKGT